MPEILVTVKIPGGDVCRDDRKCIFSKYSKAHSAYNCALYGRLLKGGENPRKCRDCREYTEKYEAVADFESEYAPEE